MTPSNKISTPNLSLPKGGGAIKGIGETFQSNPFSGTGAFSIPVFTTPARGFKPQLSLDYGSGSGNGPFGAGFSLSIPNIARRTRLGMPKYDDSDLFVLSGADDLVKTYQKQADGSWTLYTYPDATNTYTITRYRPRKEGLFAKIEKWVRQSDGDIHWQVTTKDNILNIYGKSTSARIADPEDPGRVFQWLFEESYDAKGNRILYEYKQEDGVNIPNEIQEAGRSATAQVYPYKIKYGNFTPGNSGETDWHFEVVFDFGERNWDNPQYDPENTWTARQDPFSSYKSGFEIRTYRLCREILMFHRFQELSTGGPVLVRAMKLDYDENSTMAFLSKVQEIGFRQYPNSSDVTQKALPPLELTYNRPAPTFLTRLDASFFKNKISNGTIAPELWRELIFKGITIAQNATVTSVSQSNPPDWQLSDGENSYLLVQEPDWIEVYDPALQPAFQSMDLNGANEAPGMLNQMDYQLVDLYGEGIPGILYTDNDSIRYWRPEGDGRYSAPREPSLFPLEHQLGGKEMILTDLGGDGRLDLVVHGPKSNGFFPRTAGESWLPFRSFEQYPNDYGADDKEVIDVTGDGLADLVLFEEQAVKYYESWGKKGFGPAARYLDAQQIDYTTHRSREEVYRLVDIFGDGGAHLVRVRNGEVACWPNLGYGRFGKKILLGNAPRFEGQLDAQRLFFADTDGSGTTDLIYAQYDHIAVYCNQSGNSFSDPVILKLPRPYSDIDQIQFADILGVGASCLVFATRKNDLSLRHEYYSFTGGRKPYLLTEVNNNLGGLTRIQYAASTLFYLEDRRAGRPWPTRLSFPVQVVEQTDAVDYFSETKLTARYAYHDGYFDPVDREFRGFGLVERWDAEPFDLFSQNSPSAASDQYVAPVYTKSWYHTGAFREADVLTSHYRKDYFQGDDQAYSMPDSVFEDPIDQSDGDTIRQAYRALHGTLLREEVYGAGGEDGLLDWLKAPYTATESNVSIRLVQPKEENPYAVYLVNHRESISYHYEQDPADPRIEHDFTLIVDDYGHVTRSCRVFYPRRPGNGSTSDPANTVYDEQQQLKIVAGTDSFFNKDAEFYLLGVPTEEQSFEIGGLPLSGTNYFSFEQIAAGINTALPNQIPFEESLSGDSPQARQLSWRRHYYWNDDLSQALPLGQASAQELPHHSASAVFSNNLITQAFGSIISHGELNTEGGYQYDSASLLWWNPGMQANYNDLDKFYLLDHVTDPFGNNTQLDYDSYSLLVATTTDALGNQTTAEADYYSIHPWQITDINDNISQALFDPLGQVMVTSVFKSGANPPQGDDDLGSYKIKTNPSLDSILANPADYLQGATSFLYYNLDAWQQGRQPANVLSLLREIHVSDSLELGGETPIQYHLSYSDGFGRILESKVKAEPGPTIDSDANGNPISLDRWLTSGRTVYNNKGKPVKQYEPYYSDGYDYKDIQTGVTPLIHYDPLLRVIRVDTPKGFFTKSEFSPWYEKHYDENDTVVDSAYYKKYNGNTTPADQAALDQAVQDYDTPDMHVFDNQGRAFLNIQILADQSGNTDMQYLTTKSTLDIQGNELSGIDPRLNASNQSPNFEYTYDMDGDVLHLNSVDAGERWTLKNVMGRPIYTWDSRNFQTSFSYDVLHRLTRIQVAGGDGDSPQPDHVVERMVYGTNAEADKKNNLNGRLAQHYDQAGLLTAESYNLEGALSLSRRQLWKDFEKAADWTQLPAGTNDARLEKESFSFKTYVNVLGQVLQETFPDGSSTHYEYLPEGWLKNAKLLDPNGQSLASIKPISYNPKGQREQISYGNGVTTSYAYEPTTFRLLQLMSNKWTTVHQDIGYTYDPVGNITQIDNSTFKTVFHKNQQVDPISTYTYDSLYRLASATGRQHIGLTGNEYNSPSAFKQSQFAGVNDANQLENYTEKYTYDSGGNLVATQHQGGTTNSWSRTMKVEPTSNRLSEYIPAGQSTSVPLSYDSNGNITELQNLRELTWDYRNNIASATIIDRGIGNSDMDYFIYDSGGQRIRKISMRLQHGKIAVTEKVYLGAYELVRTYRGGAWTVDRQSHHLVDGDTKTAIIHTWKTGPQAGQTQIRYQLDNHLGSVSMELNEQAKLISYEEYFPYGGTAFMAGSNQTDVARKDYRYSGKERDDSTSLYYYGARYYAPWLGRWMSADPAWRVDGLNIFAFVVENPITKKDEKGEDWVRIVNSKIEWKSDSDHSKLTHQHQLKYKFINNSDYLIFKNSGKLYSHITGKKGKSNRVSRAQYIVHEFDVAPYKELNQRRGAWKRKYITGLYLYEHDHQQSTAATQLAVKGRIATAFQGGIVVDLALKNAFNNPKGAFDKAYAITLFPSDHSAGRTYGGKNTVAQIEGDATNPAEAFFKDAEAILKHFENQKELTTRIVGAFRYLYRRNYADIKYIDSSTAQKIDSMLLKYLEIAVNNKLAYEATFAAKRVLGSSGLDEKIKRPRLRNKQRNTVHPPK